MFEFENDEFIKTVTDRLEGVEWFFVGGIVRDSLLGLETNDIDIVIMISPEEVIERMKGLSLNVIGKRFGTIGVFIDKWQIEITTTRQDLNQDGRRTDVKLMVSFEHDCERRDFTFNGLLYKNGNVTDYVGGLKDLNNNEINFIGEPSQRIKEDYLRLIRYIRFYVRYGYKTLITQDIIELFRNNLQGLDNVSIERIIKELFIMCNYKNTRRAIELFNSLGISSFIFKEDLFEEINDSQTPVEKCSLIFKNLKNANGLPLNKSVKHLWNIYNVKGSIMHNIAFLWYRKSVEDVRIYIKYLIEYENEKGLLDLLNDNFNVDNSHLQSIVGPERSIAELELRKEYLKNNYLKNFSKNP